MPVNFVPVNFRLMLEVKRLAGQTAVYGMGTIVPRFLNYVVLTPLFTYTLTDAADYGVITELYAWMVILLVLLTYGMETGFFRYVNKSNDPSLVYSTALVSLFITSSLFLSLTLLTSGSIASLLNYSANRDYIKMFLAIVAIDSFCAVPFARLRSLERPLTFSIIKIANVLIIVGLSLFLLRVAPNLYESGVPLFVNYFNPDYLVGYVFVANLTGSIATLFMLLPVIFRVKFRFSPGLWLSMMGYSLPLLVGGIAGTVNDVIDKVLLRRLHGGDEGLEVVGIYGGAYKIAVLLSIFVQMFRFAAEPFFFERAGKVSAKESYAAVMKYFVICGSLLFLAVNLYLPVIQYFVGPVYREALVVVPIISFSFLLYGLFINLSVWYKVNDMTRYGAYITITGMAVTLTINLLFIPLYSYMASAWAHVACYFVMVIFSYFAGRRHYTVDYDLRSAALYISLAIILVFVSLYIVPDMGLGATLALNTLLVGLYLLLAERRDRLMTIIFGKGDAVV